MGQGRRMSGNFGTAVGFAGGWFLSLGLDNLGWVAFCFRVVFVLGLPTNSAPGLDFDQETGGFSSPISGFRGFGTGIMEAVT